MTNVRLSIKEYHLGVLKLRSVKSLTSHRLYAPMTLDYGQEDGHFSLPANFVSILNATFFSAMWSTLGCTKKHSNSSATVRYVLQAFSNLRLVKLSQWTIAILESAKLGVRNSRWHADCNF